MLRSATHCPRSPAHRPDNQLRDCRPAPRTPPRDLTPCVMIAGTVVSCPGLGDHRHSQTGARSSHRRDQPVKAQLPIPDVTDDHTLLRNKRLCVFLSGEGVPRLGRAILCAQREQSLPAHGKLLEHWPTPIDPSSVRGPNERTRRRMPKKGPAPVGGAGRKDHPAGEALTTTHKAAIAPQRKKQPRGLFWVARAGRAFATVPLAMPCLRGSSGQDSRIRVDRESGLS